MVARIFKEFNVELLKKKSKTIKYLSYFYTFKNPNNQQSRQIHPWSQWKFELKLYS